MNKNVTFIKPGPHIFEEYEYYTDPGAVNQRCRDLLSPHTGEARQLQIGICELVGPGQVAEDSHATWSQYFVVIEGEGTLYLGGREYPLSRDMIVEIPRNTPHYAKCGAGKTLKYFFINIHDLP